MSVSLNQLHHLSSALINAKGYYIVIIGMDGKYSYCNPFFNATFVEAGDTAIGKPSTFAIIEEDHQIAVDIAYKCIATPGVSKTAILRKPTAKGILSTQWEFTCVTNEQRQPQGVVCIGYDITENQRNQQITQQLLQEIQEYLDSVTDGFFTLNNQWEFTRINKVFEKMVNIPRKEMLGKYFWDSFPETADQPYTKAMRQAKENNETVRFEQYFPPDTYFSVNVFPSKEGIISYIKDISERKKQELELRDNQMKLKAIVDSTVDGNILLNKEMKVLSFNRVAKEQSLSLLGEELKPGDDIRKYVEPEQMDTFHQKFAEAISGKIVKSERTMHVGNDMVLWFEFLYYPVFDENNELMGVVLNTTMIDERKRAEIKVMEQLKKLKKIAFLQSHELRAPLTNIMGIVNVVNLLTNKIKDPDVIELLNGLSYNAIKLDEIVKKIVDATQE